ncbi:hypothetical protein N7488_001570 [Penicillium malachiteum]|nr:hypothetical protein N7488_001570 [Penicillium malachiteum]
MDAWHQIGKDKLKHGRNPELQTFEVPNAPCSVHSVRTPVVTAICMESDRQATRIPLGSSQSGS